MPVELDITLHIGGHQNGHDLLVMTRPVITPQVAGIGMSLINISLRRMGLVLQCDDSNAIVHQKKSVDSTCLQGKLVFQHGRVTARTDIRPDHFTYLTLQVGYCGTPRIPFRRRGFLDKRANTPQDIDQLGPLKRYAV